MLFVRVSVQQDQQLSQALAEVIYCSERQKNSISSFSWNVFSIFSHNIKITWREVENLRYAHCKVSLNDEDKMLNFLEDTSPEIPRKYYLERRKPVPSVTR